MRLQNWNTSHILTDNIQVQQTRGSKELEIRKSHRERGPGLQGSVVLLVLEMRLSDSSRRDQMLIGTLWETWGKMRDLLLPGTRQGSHWGLGTLVACSPWCSMPGAFVAPALGWGGWSSHPSAGARRRFVGSEGAPRAHPQLFTQDLCCLAEEFWNSATWEA